MRARHSLFAVVAVVLALVGSACAASTRHVLVVTDIGLYEALSDVHVAEQMTLCGQPSCANVTARVTPTWTDAQSQAFNQKLLPAVTTGQQFNVILSQWQPGQPMPLELHELIAATTRSLTEIITAFPEGATKTRILSQIGRVQSIVLAAVDAIVSVKGR